MTHSPRQQPFDPGPRDWKDDRLDSDYCNASGLRRKFLDFCKDNPAADECKIYDV